MLNVRKVFLLLVICATREVQIVNVVLFPLSTLFPGYVCKQSKNTLFVITSNLILGIIWYKLEFPKSLPTWVCIHKLMCSHAEPQMLSGVPPPAQTYPWATILSEVYLLWHGHNHGHRCFEVYLPALAWPQSLWGVLLLHRLIHRSQSLWLEFTLELQPVQYSSTESSSHALAICQPRHIATAVIKMFPGTAQ